MKLCLILARPMVIRQVVLIGSIVSISFLGCSNESSGKFAITGKISLNGTPVEAGTISFSPQGEITDSRAAVQFHGGRYDVPAEKGLVPGKYLVQIFAEPVDPQNISPEQLMMNEGRTNFKPPAQPIPAKYNTKSDQTVEVTAGGKNEFDFPINSR